MSHKPDMNANTIFAGVLIAGITGLLASFISRQVVTPEYPHEAAFPIEVVESAGAGGAAAGPTGPEPILALLAAADLAKGESLSKQCTACHDFTKGGANRVGPYLWGVVNRAKGQASGFAYSEELIAKGGTWSYDSLNHFLWKPKSYIAGTKMNYIGLKKPEDRAALIAWLRAQSDSPAALPSEADIAKEAAALAPPAAEVVPAEGAEGAEGAPAVAEPAADTPTAPATDANAATPAATATAPADTTAPVTPATTGVMPVEPAKAPAKAATPAATAP